MTFLSTSDYVRLPHHISWPHDGLLTHNNTQKIIPVHYVTTIAPWMTWCNHKPGSRQHVTRVSCSVEVEPLRLSAAFASRPTGQGCGMPRVLLNTAFNNGSRSNVEACDFPHLWALEQIPCPPVQLKPAQSFEAGVECSESFSMNSML